jgi:hypothetical protein
VSTAYGDALERRAAQVEEYSQYVAAEEIRNATGVVIYGKGWPVPAGNVEADGSIILLRHACPGVDPFTGDKCTIEHNAILERSYPKMAVRVSTKAEAKKEASK